MKRHLTTLSRRCLVIGAGLPLTVLLMAACRSEASDPKSAQAVEIKWPADKEFTNLSGIAVVGNYLVVVDDESHQAVYVLERHNSGYRYFGKVRLAEQDDGELDLEGVAADGAIVYVIGSHSRNKNKERQKARERVYQFELGSDGALKGKVRESSLREAIVAHPLLEPASHKKPKKGGVDIEGIATRDSWLYAGFRGPLSGENALVLKFRFEDPAKSAELLTVGLGGLGVRDLTRVSDGFLILAGPMDDGAGPYQLQHWNGNGGPSAKVRRLSDIPTPLGAKAEGLAVLSEEQAVYELLVLFDGPSGGNPTRFRINK